MHQSGCDRIGHPHKDGGDRRGGVLYGHSCIRRDRDEGVGFLPDQLGCKRGEAFETARLMTVLNYDVLPLDVTQVEQTLPKRLQARRV